MKSYKSEGRSLQYTTLSILFHGTSKVQGLISYRNNFATGSTYPSINTIILSTPLSQPSVPTLLDTGAVHSMSDATVVHGLIDVIVTKINSSFAFQTGFAE